MRPITIIAILLCLYCVAHAQTQPAPPVDDRDRIKIERAKEKQAAQDSPVTARPWDKDASGRRPWEPATSNKQMPGIPR